MLIMHNYYYVSVAQDSSLGSLEVSFSNKFTRREIRFGFHVFEFIIIETHRNSSGLFLNFSPSVEVANTPLYLINDSHP